MNRAVDPAWSLLLPNPKPPLEGWTLTLLCFNGLVVAVVELVSRRCSAADRHLPSPANNTGYETLG